ncbi:hypothetical protein C8T65DRAFT_834557 [Cerioporus squamosus]|nr:hypothetical protein C8T65DRAFT_834557 [Cerioporus squamosus]
MANTQGSSSSSSPKHLPYRDPSIGNLIIRTSDGIDFHLHHRRIADVCPIFADMATLPDRLVDASSSAGDKEKAVVQVSETSKVWEKLLPICHLTEEPPLSLEDIQCLLEAARKYDMVGVASRMRTALLHPDFLEKKPYAVYALACAGGFEDVAQRAARRTLRYSIYPEDCPEYTSITGRAFFRLFEYRQECGLAASSAVLSSPHEPHLTGCKLPMGYVQLGGRELFIALPWMDYLKKVAEEVKISPDGGVAERPKILSVVSEVVKQCPGCQATFYDDATNLARILRTIIEFAVDEVHIAFEQ